MVNLWLAICLLSLTLWLSFPTVTVGEDLEITELLPTPQFLFGVGRSRTSSSQKKSVKTSRPLQGFSNKVKSTGLPLYYEL